MQLPDITVLAAALGSGEPLALCLPVVSGLVRVSTSPSAFAPRSAGDLVGEAVIAGLAMEAGRVRSATTTTSRAFPV